MKTTLIVKLKTVQVNNDRISVKVRIDRDNLEPNEVDAVFTGSQLDVRFQPQVSKVDDAEGQLTFGPALGMVCDCGAVTCRTDGYEFSVKGPAPDDDAERGHWTRLSGKTAKMTYERMAASTAQDGGDDGDE